ncbi:MAG: glutamine synthetase family protein [Pseudomonadota bacterium]
MAFAEPSELTDFLSANPEVELLEVLMLDFHGLLRCKRIQKQEFNVLYSGEFSVPGTIPFLGIRGDLYDGLSLALVGGDPDRRIRPVAGTLVLVPWYESPVAQVLIEYVGDHALDADAPSTGDVPALAGRSDEVSWIDPRTPLLRVLDRYRESKLKVTVAAELEFYLVDPTPGERPRPLLGKVPGTDRTQSGIQYCMADDLFDCDAFLEEVRAVCKVQNVPLTAIHSEFSPGQWEINTHYQHDPVLAADHAVLLKRIVKGVARKHGWAATFMAKPFADHAGSGLHVHVAVYDDQGQNLLADSSPDSHEVPRLMPRLRHAVAGLAATLEQGMAIFAPNPNSYRRFKAGSFAPSGSNWGYDHREATLRIPASAEESRRIEHRVAGADANPYLVIAAVLAGVHQGLECPREPPEPLPREADLSDAPITLPKRLEVALLKLQKGEVLTDYLGNDFVDSYTVLRQAEADDYYSQIPDIDYDWFLRAL